MEKAHRYLIVLIAACLMGAPAFADGHLVERGAKVFKKCRSCHRVGEGARNGVGPHLNGLFGRKAGAVEGYRYSKSMKRASGDGLVWDFETLDFYIENPKNFVSGTKMKFRGLKKKEDRDAVLAFLRVYSDDPQNIPEAAPTEQVADPLVDPATLAIEGDPDYGEYLSSECVTCHRADGGDEGIPSITGWPKDDFVTALHAYRSKHRLNEAMRLVTSRLSDEEIAGLAAYFAKLE